MTQDAHVQPATKTKGLPWQRLAVLTIARLVINAGLRIVYPFLPVLARGVDRPVADLSRLLALRGAMGVLGPLFGPLSDIHGRRTMLLAGMALFTGGALSVVLVPTFVALAISMMLVALAKIIFDPALQGLVADKVPYARRGTALGWTETSWAGGLLLGAPLAGWLISLGASRSAAGFDEGRFAAAWSWPFGVLGLLGLVMLLLVWHATAGSDERSGSRVASRNPLRALQLMRRRGVTAATAFVGLIMLANELIFVSYGTWMETEFGVSPYQLGLSIVAIGLAELVGELGVGRLVDAFGKRRTVIAMTFSAAGFMAVYAAWLGWLRWSDAAGSGMIPALLCLAAAFLCFEMAYVGSLPLLTELVPEARAGVMSLVVAAMSLGRACGALLAPWLWQDPMGIMPVAGLASIAFAVGGWIVVAALPEPKTV